MEGWEKEKFLESIKGSWVCLLVGFFFLILCLLIVFLSPDTSDWTEVKGEIVRIECRQEECGGETEFVETAFVNYTDKDGNTYENVPYPYFDGTMKVGGEVVVLYDPTNPARIDSPSGNYLPYIGIAVGAIMIVGTVFVSVKKAKEE